LKTENQEAEMDAWGMRLCLVLVVCSTPGRTGVAQQAPGDGLTRVRAAIDAQNRAWADATLRGDAAAIARIFADSGVEVGVSSGRIWKGRAAIESLFVDIYRHPHATDAVVETEQIILDRRTAVEYGHYRFTYPPKDGQAQVDSGKYVVVWRQDGDGVWRIIMDMGVPAPTAP
jgi:uncharacterized protein (TIGR02246 family)